MKWTREQEAVIRSRNQDLLVSAAAGSGKTAVLVERIVQRMTDPASPVDADRLLVVTFTRAAASEMKDRIAARLSEMAQQKPEDLRLAVQMTLVRHARIETIDSFCSEVVHSHFDLLGLDPDLRTPQPEESRILARECARRVLLDRYEAEDADFLAFAEAYSGICDDESLENWIVALSEKADSRPDPEAWLASLSDAYVSSGKEQAWMTDMAQKTAARIAGLADRTAQLIAFCRYTPGLERYLEPLQTDLETLTRASRAVNWEALHGMAPQGKLSFAHFPGGRCSAEQSAKARLMKAHKQIKEKANSLLGVFSRSVEEVQEELQEQLPAVRMLSALTLDFRVLFSEAKRRKGWLDFADMEHFAHRILLNDDKTPSAAASAYADLFEEILIDEYQDSNLLQEEILTAVSRIPRGEHNLFCVGDVKQSIYSFRQAEPELFVGKMTSYGTGEADPARRIDLSVNFRSRPEVLLGTNALFSGMMRADLGGVEYDESAFLVPGRPDVGTCEAPFLVETLLVRTEDGDADGRLGADATEEPFFEDDEGATSAETTDIEAEALALGRPVTLLPEALMIGEKIRSMMEDPDFRIPDPASGEGASRPVRYSDIVILLRAPNTCGRPYADTLMEMGIPAYLADTAGFFSAPEIRIMLALLEVVENPLQDIPMASVLRSPLVGMTDDQMLLLRRSAPDAPSFSEAVSAARMRLEEAGEGAFGEFWSDPDAVHKLKKLDALLRGARRRMADMPVHTLLSGLMRQTDYLTYVSAMPQGTLRRGNLEKLIDEAVSFEETGDRSLHGFLTHIRRMKKFSTDYGMADAAVSGGEAVRILSIHKSKGLEYPVVFVSGLHRSFRLRDQNGGLTVHQKAGVSFDYRDPRRRLKRRGAYGCYLAARQEEDIRGEELRVLYVAMTRAREKLVLTGELSGSLPERTLGYADRAGAMCYLDWLIPALETAKGNPALAPLSLLPVPKRAQARSQDRSAAERRRIWETHFSQAAWNPSLSDIKKGLDYTYPRPADPGYKIKYSVSELKHRAVEEALCDDEAAVVFDHEPAAPGEGSAPESAGRSRELSAGAKRGTAMHRALECYDFKRPDFAESLEAQLAVMEREGFLTEEQRGLIVLDRLQAFLDSSLAKRMHDAAEKGLLFQEEIFFMGGAPSEFLPVVPNHGEEDMIFVQGIIDVFFQEGEDIVLVDYKTDRVGNVSELAGRYREQMRLYAAALSRWRHRNVSQILLYSLSLNEVTEIFL